MRLTASRLQLARHCRYPFRPDVDADPAWDASGEAALTGSAVHAMIAHHLDDSHVAAVPDGADAVRARRMFSAWLEWARVTGTVQSLTSPTARIELPLTIDMETGLGRVLPSARPRDYSAAAPSELVGTADAAVPIATGVLVVDWKTGDPSNIEPPATNLQLGMLALAAARLGGTDRATVALGLISEDGVLWTEATLDAFDLDAIEAELRAIVASIPNAEPVPGDHCRYCPARSVCPAFVEAAALTMAPRPGPLTATDVARAWRQAALVDAAIEQVRDRIRAYVAEHGEVPTGDGKALRLVPVKPREHLSLASVRRAMVDGEAKATIAHLRAAGAIETTAPGEALREVRR